jgi:hypothetical protein
MVLFGKRDEEYPGLIVVGNVYRVIVRYGPTELYG